MLTPRFALMEKSIRWVAVVGFDAGDRWKL